MVKTDDYMQSSAASFDIKGKDEMMIGREEQEEDETSHGNWSPRSKSIGLKYTEYESDESGGGQIPNSKKASIDGEMLDDRRLRRQIANCNERRRMQSINAGFQALRQLLPRKDGDKMSKASILAATADFIQNLLHERTKLLEENAMSAGKRRRLDVGEENGAPTMEEMPVNVIECIKTIGELRDLLSVETQLRMNYERELSELRNKLQAFPSPASMSDLSPNSSVSSIGDRNRSLLIELATRQQQQQQHDNSPQLYRPTPIAPSVATDVNIISSAIASLTKNSPPGSAHPGLLAPIGIRQQDQSTPFPAPPLASSSNPLIRAPNSSSLFIGQQTPQQNGSAAHQQTAQQPQAIESQASISQRNLQALVLAIRHLEGTSSSNGNLLVR